MKAPEPKTDFAAILRRLNDFSVEYVLIGGVAAIIHGTARATYDVDVVYNRSRDNIARLAAALSGLNPYLRGAPPGLPFQFDSETVQRGLNFTLTTALGNLDVLGYVVGGGEYRDILPHAEIAEFAGIKCQCLGLRKLIEVKRAAGRPKDFEPIAELERLLELRGGT